MRQYQRRALSVHLVMEPDAVDENVSHLFSSKLLRTGSPTVNQFSLCPPLKACQRLALL